MKKATGAPAICMRKAPRLPEGDDGRTFVNMNVEGMPWYHRQSPDAENSASGSGKYEMTKEESRMYLWGALKAALAVALIFAVVFFLFILFCDKIWFN